MARTMLTLAAVAAIGISGLALAQTEHGHGKGLTVKTLSAVDVNEEVNGKPTRATTQEVTFEPGAASAPHRHPGAVFGYVLEGAVRMQVKGQPERIFKPGETFFEAPSDVHLVSANANADVPARFLAYFVCDRETRLSVPVTDADKAENEEKE